MKTSKERLERLRILSDVVRENELAKFAGLKTRIDALNAEISKLRTPQPGADSGSAFALSGGDDAWQKWRRTRIMACNRELAMLLSRYGTLQGRARRAVGRSELLTRVSDGKLGGGPGSR